MSASVPFILLILLVHLGVYLTSSHRQRLKRLLQALLVMLLAVPVFLLGSLLADAGGVGNVGSAAVGRVLMYAPVYIPLLSFLVYLRS